MKNRFHDSFTKRFIDILGALTFFLFGSPLFIVFAFVIATTSGLPIIFKQKRIGKMGKVFNIYKFRTMKNDAEKTQYKLKNLNQADGPVFKIANDPRFTKFGKLLARSGFDELPQLINVLKGEMSLVGPRPLPVNEANKLTKKEKIREGVKPGMTSTWVIKGSHNLRFSEWMKLDKEYVETATILTDLKVILDTLIVVSNFKLF